MVYWICRRSKAPKQGDGCFHTDGKRHWFILTQAEVRILFQIRSMLGYGKVQCTTKGYFRLEITNREGIKQLILIFNGRLVCSARKNQFSKWITVWNERYPDESICELNCVGEPSLSNAWISGFMDAEGGLSISIAPRGSDKPRTLAVTIASTVKYRVRPRVF